MMTKETEMDTGINIFTDEPETLKRIIRIMDSLLIVKTQHEQNVISSHNTMVGSSEHIMSNGDDADLMLRVMNETAWREKHKKSDIIK